MSASWGNGLELVRLGARLYDMTTKQKAVKSIAQLPDTATWEDIEERIRFLAAIDRGLEDIKQGKLIPHEEVRASLEEWLSA